MFFQGYLRLYLFFVTNFMYGSFFAEELGKEKVEEEEMGNFYFLSQKP